MESPDPEFSFVVVPNSWGLYPISPRFQAKLRSSFYVRVDGPSNSSRASERAAISRLAGATVDRGQASRYSGNTGNRDTHSVHLLATVRGRGIGLKRFAICSLGDVRVALASAIADHAPTEELDVPIKEEHVVAAL